MLVLIVLCGSCHAPLGRFLPQIVFTFASYTRLIEVRHFIAHRTRSNSDQLCRADTVCHPVRCSLPAQCFCPLLLSLLLLLLAVRSVV